MGEENITGKSPIGVFDSGIGGLTILDSIARLLPHEDIIYYADTAHCPYGGKEREEIVRISDNVIRELEKEGAKVIVIACNTASISSSAELRKKHPLPIVATEPAVKPAVENTHTGVVGVLATQSTINSGQIEKLAGLYGKGKKVLKQAGGKLVELAEKGETDGAEAYDTIKELISPMIAENCDHIVLGCTHFPFFRDTITAVLEDTGASGVKVIDTAGPVAKRVKWILENNGLLNGTGEKGRITFVSSAGHEDSLRIKKIFETKFTIEK